MTELQQRRDRGRLSVFLGEETSVGLLYEAGAFDANDVCFTFPIIPELGENFEVRYGITSDEISVHMNLRSVANSSSILRRRLLPAKFKRFYEHSSNLTEPYEVEFCATSEIIGDNTASAVIVGVFADSRISGW